MPIQYLFAYLLLETATLSGQKVLPRAPLDRKKARKISILKRILGRNHKISKPHNSNSKNATRKALHREIREFALIDNIHNLGPYRPTAHEIHILNRGLSFVPTPNEQNDSDTGLLSFLQLKKRMLTQFYFFRLGKTRNPPPLEPRAAGSHLSIITSHYTISFKKPKMKL